ncbi:hypothetical protein FGG08_004061 [Glutinoglossum americanum]|uniref:Zn(2)-C6 fungal-type domain-containing protein n=1 Tax=Glutinoglossum americanum TaxID=1670608 RepID=A0A9P8I6E6_9PEZI|nr:hypothetical protein FGG08_004061 [Glutinoglossum americanum]
MIVSFNITTDDRQIAIYAGMVTSAFAFAEFSTGVVWGRLSDRIGRKPVLITGLAGTGLSMLIFGFAPSLPIALLGRALGGFLNGNIGVLQTTVAELITVKEHQPRAYAIMPFVWCLGSILGPILGGALADPCKSYPGLFQRGTIFDKFPYLLPNLVCAVILTCGVAVGILFLEETHEEKKYRRDIGLEIGDWIISKVKLRLTFMLRTEGWKIEIQSKLGDANLEERRSLLEEDEQPPGYRTTEGSPKFSVSRALSEGPNDREPSNNIDREPPALERAFTKQVVLHIIGYGILAYHTISFDQLMPVFLSTPSSHEPRSLPFKFTGGFALSTKTIGFILSLQGFYSMLAQLFLFPVVVRRFGCLQTFRCVAMCYPLLYLLVPYLILLPEQLQVPGIYLCLILKITAQVLAYPSNAILLTNSAPSMLVLGAINGVAASTASLSRAFGPTISGLIHSAGLKLGFSGLAWWAGAVVCFLGAVESLLMEEVQGRFDRRSSIDDVVSGNEDCFDSLAVGAAVVEAGHAGNASDRAQLDQYSIAKDCHLTPRTEISPGRSYEGLRALMRFLWSAEATSPVSTATSGYPLKRPRSPSDEAPAEVTPAQAGPSPPASAISSSSSFRNVSACNRCRLRKNRCDQRLPACASCEKAQVKCVGYDPITKREIPRSYVYYLETRVSYLESVLQSNDIAFAAPERLDLSSRPGPDPNVLHTPTEEHQFAISSNRNVADASNGYPSASRGTGKRQNEAEKLSNLVSNIGMVSVQGASDPRYLGSTSGISFARVVFAAVKSSVSGSSSERAGIRPSKPITAGVASSGSTSMRDSFFGLHTKPTFEQAPFPDRELGSRLADLYFEHANPQIPILHRGEFMSLCDRVYSSDERLRTPRELYMLNIVFAIGAGIFLGETDSDDVGPDSHKSSPRLRRSPPSPTTKRVRLSSQQYQPEEYHASAIVHLESFLGSSPAADRPDGFGGGLEELQAVLLLAGFALLRPVAPGLWYIVGVAVRLGVDLGLHHEDGTGIDAGNGDEDVAMGSTDPSGQTKFIDPKEKGRREWVRDLRRRLWWCVYSFDRLVSTCVGRPFGISDEVVTTEFPSLLDDAFITTAGFSPPPNEPLIPSYKLVAHHYFRLRLLQSEILQVLQHQQAQQARMTGDFGGNPYMHTHLQSPFLQKFGSFRSWRTDIDRRLREWKDSAPRKEEIGVQFSTEFLQLNYWQAVIMLYRQSLTVPPLLAGEYNTSDEVSSPSMVNIERREDEEQVFLKVAEAGQRVLRIYRQLHRVHLVNYTFLATHHLFMAVRRRITLDNIDFTVLAATSVLNDLIEKCPPAEACRDAFERMSRATVQMCLATTGFSSQASGLGSDPVSSTNTYRSTESNFSDQEGEGSLSSDIPSWNDPVQGDSDPNPVIQRGQAPRRPPPKFDMNFGDLFSEEADSSARSARQNYRSRPTQGPIKMEQQCPPYQTLGGLGQQDFGLETSNIDPNLQTQQQTERQARSFMPSPQPSYPINSNNNNNNNTNVFADFFEDPDFALDNTVAGNSGIDLGFGLAFDVDHDFSDGSQFDLFDGFFFGPSSSGL